MKKTTISRAGRAAVRWLGPTGWLMELRTADGALLDVVRFDGREEFSVPRRQWRKVDVLRNSNPPLVEFEATIDADVGAGRTCKTYVPTPLADTVWAE